MIPGPAPAQALAATIAKGLAGLTSAHLVVDAGSLGGKSAGNFAYRDGIATASDVVLDNGADTTRIITIGNTSYAQLPKARNTTGKPWVIVSATSKNEFVRALASSVTLSKAAGSLPAVADLAGTASSVVDKGSGHYALVIDPTHSSGTTLGVLLADIGQKTVPVDVYLDSAGRPVKVRITVVLGKQTMLFRVDASRFNAPLHISAPAANQVSSL